MRANIMRQIEMTPRRWRNILVPYGKSGHNHPAPELECAQTRIWSTHECVTYIIAPSRYYYYITCVPRTHIYTARRTRAQSNYTEEAGFIIIARAWLSRR